MSNHMEVGAMTIERPHVTASRRRGRPARPFPPTRKQLLDDAKKEAVKIGFGQSGAELMHRDCGSHSDPIRWFCVQTHPGQEARAAEELRRQDFITFLPVAVVSRGCEHRRKFVVRPALPRYLFVAFDPDASPWRKIWSTYGVSRLFMAMGDLRPAPAVRGDVERLIDMVEAEIGKVDPTATAVTLGAKGVVTDGPFSSFRCVVMGPEIDGKIRVAVEMFGRQSQFSLERHAVRLDGE
ncbi:transcription termination/antitermination protein NusG [Roseomonas elaeocarpi]|uniref:Transcription termination/antitermination protein NusG n=1 Tax=Roseomonas elaeocarpi TaxID=907779 RepID=A0ABV6JQE0_9PROT